MFTVPAVIRWHRRPTSSSAVNTLNYERSNNDCFEENSSVSEAGSKNRKRLFEDIFGGNLKQLWEKSNNGVWGKK